MNRNKVKKRIKSDLKIKTVVILLITLLVNTYAWFIYVSTVFTGVKMHIKSWEFELSASDQSQEFFLVVDQIYPGMNIATKEINAKNKGEAEAALAIDLTKIKILDEIYEVGVDYPQPDGSVINYTSDELIQKLLNDYPFKVKIYINNEQYTSTNNQILQTGESTSILLEVNWDYETGEIVDGIADGDEEDTYWGTKSYEYMENNKNGDKYSVQVDLTIKAVQNNSENNKTS